MPRIHFIVVGATLGLFAIVRPDRAGPTMLAIDGAHSRVVIDVGKAGMLGFAGHAHEVVAPAVSGTVEFDPRDVSRSTVRLHFDTAALKVTGKGEPPSDVPEVQRAMLGESVLDVTRFPSIVYTSRRLTLAAQTSTSADVAIDGDLTLHGVTRPTTVRAAARLGADGVITAHGSFSIRQTDFGIQPVAAGGGTVRVRDEVAVVFDLVARPAR